MSVSKLRDKKSKNRYMQIFYYSTLTEHVKKVHEISVKFIKSICEFSVKFDVF